MSKSFDRTFVALTVLATVIIVAMLEPTGFFEYLALLPESQCFFLPLSGLTH